MLERGIDFLTALPVIVVAYGRVPDSAGEAILSVPKEVWAEKFRQAVRSSPTRTLTTVQTMLHRGLIPRFFRVLEEWECLDVLDDGLKRLFLKVEELYSAVGVGQRKAADEFAAAMIRGDRISPILKSHETSDRFGLPLEREMHYDVDFLIHWEDYEEAYRILTEEMGFVQGEFRDGKIVEVKDPRTEETSQQHYEWWPFLKCGPSIDFDIDSSAILHKSWPFAPGEVTNSTVRTFTSVDLHYGIDPEIPSSAAWKRVVEYLPCRYGLSASLLLWFICARLYHETTVHAGQKFRPLGQVIDIVARGDVEWEDVSGLCAEHKTEPATYYVLRAVEDLCGVSPPQGWLKDLEVRFVGQGHLRDFGPLWSALLRLNRDERLSVAT